MEEEEIERINLQGVNYQIVDLKSRENINELINLITLNDNDFNEIFQ